jgi:hypothetical protein
MDPSLVGPLFMNLCIYGMGVCGETRAARANWRWVRGQSWVAAGVRLATGDSFPPILESRPSILTKGHPGRKILRANEISFKNLWKSFRK